MGLKSKTKGKVGEREVAELLREFGFNARRGQQFAGGGDSPDVVSDMEGFHIEVKRTGKQTDIFAALEQAKRDRKKNADGSPAEDALVFHRKNNKDWIVAMDAREFMRLVVKYIFN
jgi:Holliday junction resolvase